MKIILIGNGNMGRIVKSVAKEQIIKVIENFKYNTIEENLNCDVIIDFSHRENLKSICKYAKEKKCKVVIATTNLNDEDYNLINELANYTSVIVDSNFSYGILLLKKIIKENLLQIKNYDIQIVEKHHKYKKDSPSGTAKSIGEILNKENIKYNTSSIRGGTLRGEHEIILYGDEEYIEIKHFALSRKIYALGALEAAKWLMCKEKGLFSFEDCIFSE